MSVTKSSSTIQTILPWLVVIIILIAAFKLWENQQQLHRTLAFNVAEADQITVLSAEYESLAGVADKDTKIKVSKNKNQNLNQEVQTIKVESNNTNRESLKSSNDLSGIQITSPIIGTAYHAPEPGAKKFVEVGKKIKKGDTVMIIEAMKTMNHVPSTENGVVKEICVEDGQAVEFGQPIVILK